MKTTAVTSEKELGPCPKCGVELLLPSSCRSHSANRYKARRQRDLPLAPCAECGTLCVGKTCSVTCRNRWIAKNHRPSDFGLRDCAVCGAEFRAAKKNQLYCSMRCQHKRNAEAYKDTDWYREMKERSSNKKVSRQRIGLNIRDSHLQIPSRDAKWLWDGVGKWSVKYWPEIQECLECGTNVYRHESHGICERCYSLMKPKDPEQVRKWQRKSYEKAKSVRRLSAQQSKDWIAKAKAKEIEITPTIGNLLENLERL